jgi:hypothetical protein
MWSGEIGGRTVNIGLASSDVSLADADSILMAGRALILTALVVWFGRSAGKQVGAYLRGMAATDSGGANFGVENLVPGVAQGKQLALASVVTVAIFTGVAAMVGIVDVGLNFAGLSVSTLATTLDVHGLGSGLAMLDRYFPVVACLAIYVEESVIPWLCAPVFGVAVVVVKFVKP